MDNQLRNLLNREEKIVLERFLEQAGTKSE